ncbi:MAG TPA: tRNA pseudouridine(38-40) synthase TruA [Cytophagaceae bacterium]
MRYFLEIAYKGTNYHGWQIQNNAHTIQAELENALKLLLGTSVDTIASGRTDAGVHAEQQFVHFDSSQKLTTHHLFKLNKILPEDVWVKAGYRVVDNANARFDAISRSYEYRIFKTKNPFYRGLYYYYFRPLNIALMQQASDLLLKHQDYQCFSRVKTSVEHFLCDITEAQWIDTEEVLIFKIKANRFLRGMVRTIVGTLLEVGLEKLSVEEFESIILAKDRKQAGRSAPPEGLYFTKIEYPSMIFIEPVQ